MHAIYKMSFDTYVGVVGTVNKCQKCPHFLLTTGALVHQYESSNRKLL